MAQNSLKREKWYLRKMNKKELKEDLQQIVKNIMNTMVDPLTEEDPNQAERYKGWLQASHFAIDQINFTIERI